jgi:choline kinase
MRQAVILAAGSGTRLGRSIPKTLTVVAGRPLLGWIAAALREVGVETVHVIVSDSSPFEDAARSLSGSLELRLHACPDWQLGNGRSAAFARGLVSDERFFLLMGDHWVSAAHLHRVAGGSLEGSVLGTSPPAPWMDLADATKVAIDDAGTIREIGKELAAFNAIDSGVFAMTHAIFPALESACAAGDYSLTAGNRRLCQAGLLSAASLGDLRWYDIDTPADLVAADAWLTGSATKL